MRFTPLRLLLAITCVVLAACSSVRVQRDLVRHFAELQEAGNIPGLPPDAHGHFRTEGVRFGARVTYPLSQQIYLSKNNDPADYTYYFTKETKTAEWQLITAWRSLPNGQPEELKVK